MVLDNLGPYKTAALYETFPLAEALRILMKLEFHYTPKHASWLTMVEIKLSVFDRRLKASIFIFIALTCHLRYLICMEFPELVDIVGDEPVFDTGLLLAGDANPREVRRQLSRWKQTGKIIQLRRGLYCLAPPFQKVNPHPYLVANRLIPASYVSLQSALAHYGMIPEHVPVTTSVTTSRPAQWETPLGIFDFRRIQIEFFDGYRFVDLGEKQRSFVATPEKALLDLIYLESGSDSVEYLVELRLGNLNRLDLELLEHLARKIEKPKLMRAIAVIRELAREEGEFETL